MSCKICGSFAINEHLFGREIGVDADLCDVHYWMKRAEATSLQAERVGELEEALALCYDHCRLWRKCRAKRKD